MTINKEIEKPKEITIPTSVIVSVFFEKIAPYKKVSIKPEIVEYQYSITLTPIQLDCHICNGVRFFQSNDKKIVLPINRSIETFVHFICKNCSRSTKTYSINLVLSEDKNWAYVFKYGEYPLFGFATPSKVITLLGNEKEYFLRGRRCETQGLGIGALTYYRRIIEEKRNSLFDEIIRVSEKLGASDELIQELNLAKQETQFSKAIESIKHAIPQALLINGRNPLTLLHSALSEGVHTKTDEECLAIAESIRIVLFEFVEKLSQAMKNDLELNEAVNRLINSKSSKKRIINFPPSQKLHT
ncbi:MAG: hypothetical protein U1E36_03715 [Rickettsiales bacterium]